MSPGRAGGDGDLAAVMGGLEGVDEEALATEDGALEAAQDTAADAGGELDGVGHADHRPGFRWSFSPPRSWMTARA